MGHIKDAQVKTWVSRNPSTKGSTPFVNMQQRRDNKTMKYSDSGESRFVMVHVAY